jgi:hypothetical protein
VPQAVGDHAGGNFHHQHRHHQHRLQTGDLGEREVPLQEIGCHEWHEEIELAEKGNQADESHRIQRTERLPRKATKKHQNLER